MEVQGDQVKVVFYNDNSHLTEDISTFARQSWWRTQGKVVDANLWFRPLDMEKNGDFYYKAREEAWITIHGSMLHFDGDGFLRDAKDQAKYDPRSVMQVMLGSEPAGVLQLNLRRDADKARGLFRSFIYCLKPVKGGLEVIF